MVSVKCPHCDAFTVNEPALAVGTVFPLNQVEYSYSLTAQYPVTSGGISAVQCKACEREFLVEGWRAIWPLRSPSAPAYVPEKVKEAYEDARRAHSAGANIGALMAARTTLLRFLRDKDAANFKQLVERQIITPAIYGGVDQLRLWAAIAGHDDIDVDTFDPQEVEDILDYLGTALESAYTH